MAISLSTLLSSVPSAEATLRTILSSSGFLDFLKSTPAALAKMIAIAQAWYELQQQIPSSGMHEDGPDVFVPGQETTLTSIGISAEDLEALEKGYAVAIVKEKAITYVKGFITGISLA